MDANLMRYLTADMQAGIDDREPLFLNEFMDECPRCGFLHTKTWNHSGGYYDELVTERFCPACWHSWNVRVMVGDVGGDPTWDDYGDYSDDPELFWEDVQADGDPCVYCGSRNTDRIDIISHEPDVWIAQCGSCGETFEVMDGE